MNTLSKINISTYQTDPSLTVNGDIWYNGTTGKFRKMENGVVSDWSITDSTGSIPQINAATSLIQTQNIITQILLNQK